MLQSTMQRFRLSREQRVRSSQDFATIYERRMKSGDNHLLVFAAPNGLPHARLGLSVSKKHGNAIRRAELKRRLREAFRLSQHDLPAGVDLVLIPRIKSGATVNDYRRSLVSRAKKLAKRLAESDTSAVS